MKWPELHPGADGLTRVFTIRTSSTTLKRPIHKLVLLPTTSTATDAQAIHHWLLLR